MKAVTKSKLKLAGTVGFFFVWFIMLLIFVGGFFAGLSTNRILALNIRVDAILVEAFPASLGTSGSYWDLMYEFIDEDGMEYSGRAGMHFTKKADAEKHIGDIFPIYIDGEGRSFDGITKKWTTSKLIVFGTIAVISVSSAPAYIIVFLVPHKKRVKSKIDHQN